MFYTCKTDQSKLAKKENPPKIKEKKEGNEKLKRQRKNSMRILYEGKNIRKVSIGEGMQNRHSKSTIILKCLIIKDETKEQNEIRLREGSLIRL